MQGTDQHPKRTKSEILREIDTALPVLPLEQQNMVAAFAQGLRTGLSLRAGIEPAPDAAREEDTIQGQATCHR